MEKLEKWFFNLTFGIMFFLLGFFINTIIEGTYLKIDSVWVKVWVLSGFICSTFISKGMEIIDNKIILQGLSE